MLARYVVQFLFKKTHYVHVRLVAYGTPSPSGCGFKARPRLWSNAVWGSDTIAKKKNNLKSPILYQLISILAPEDSEYFEDPMGEFCVIWNLP